MKVAELSGAKLDYWVAKAAGCKPYVVSDICYLDTGVVPSPTFMPSTNWCNGGPIIEREKIDTTYCNVWYALHNAAYTDERHMREFSGPSPLIAAMRCFVASKFGEEVPDAE